MRVRKCPRLRYLPTVGTCTPLGFSCLSVRPFGHWHILQALEYIDLAREKVIPSTFICFTGLH